MNTQERKIICPYAVEKYIEHLDLCLVSPKIWFTSDTHFGSSRTLELSKRPFKSTRAMDKYIISQWNKVVKKHDIVFHLGDFGDPSKLCKLNGGMIVLVLGNYDDGFTLGALVSDDRVLLADKSTALTLLPSKDKQVPTFIIHEPTKMGSLGSSGFKLFGHIHKLQMVKRDGLNVGTDCHNFRPIDVDEVLFYYNAIVNHYDENVFCS